MLFISSTFAVEIRNLATMNPVDNPNSRFYDPTVTAIDLAAWMNWSYGTAVRRYHDMKVKLGIPGHRRPYKSQVLEYFGINL